MPMNGRLLRPRQTGFTPRSISGLALWLDPTDATSYTIATGVSEWRDKSGNNKHFTQSVGNNQPTLTTIGGKTALNFNGTSHHLFTTSTLFTGNASFTFFQVFEGTFPGNGTALFTHKTGEGGADTNDITVGLSANQGPSWLFGTLRTRVSTIRSGAAVNADQRFDNVDASGIGAISLVGACSASPTSTAWFKGTAAPSSSGTSSLTSVSGMTLGCRNNPTRDLFYVGKMGEVIAYNRTLTTTERRRVESYLARKWGYTTLSAPIVSNADAQDWIERVYANGGTVSAATANAVNQFCVDIENAGIRDRFYRLNLFAGNSDASLAAVRTPLFRGPSLTGTQFGNALDTSVNFVQGDYAETGASGGLLGNGSTKFLRTGLATNALTVGDRHLSAYEVVRSGATFDLFLGSDVAGGQQFILGYGSPANVVRFGYGAFSANVTSSATTTGGHWLGVNPTTTSGIIYKNGVADGNNTSSAATPPSYEMYAFANNRDNAATDFYGGRLGGYSIGAAFTAAQALAYYNAMQAFQTALGRQV